MRGDRLVPLDHVCIAAVGRAQAKFGVADVGELAPVGRPGGAVERHLRSPAARTCRAQRDDAEAVLGAAANERKPLLSGAQSPLASLPCRSGRL